MIVKPTQPPDAELANSRTILLDGLWGNPSRLSVMKRRLEAGGLRSVETFAYDSSGFACLEAEGRRLARFLRTSENPVNLVGYSMGGLLIRSAIREGDGLPVNKVAFLNTPHGGSKLARFLPGVGISQMRPGCEFLQRIDAEPWPYETLAVWTPGDLMVLPSRSACWSRAKKTSVCRVPAHVWPLISSGLHRELAEFLLSK